MHFVQTKQSKRMRIVPEDTKTLRVKVHRRLFRATSYVCLRYSCFQLDSTNIFLLFRGRSYLSWPMERQKNINKQIMSHEKTSMYCVSNTNLNLNTSSFYYPSIFPISWRFRNGFERFMTALCATYRRNRWTGQNIKSADFISRPFTTLSRVCECYSKLFGINI